VLRGDLGGWDGGGFGVAEEHVVGSLRTATASTRIRRFKYAAGYKYGADVRMDGRAGWDFGGGIGLECERLELNDHKETVSRTMGWSSCDWVRGCGWGCDGWSEGAQVWQRFGTSG
jgi:hypothetical protein